MTAQAPSPTTLPSDVERLLAMRAARFAASRGLPATVCPYDPDSTDNRVRVLALVWVREYLRRTSESG